MVCLHNACSYACECQSLKTLALTGLKATAESPSTNRRSGAGCSRSSAGRCWSPHSAWAASAAWHPSASAAAQPRAVTQSPALLRAHLHSTCTGALTLDRTVGLGRRGALQRGPTIQSKGTAQRNVASPQIIQAK